MPKIPPISGKKFLRVVDDYCFWVVRQKGSHAVVQHSSMTSRSTVVPLHNNEDLGRGLLKSILEDLEIEEEDFLLMMKKKKTSVELLRLDRRYLH